MRIAICDDEAHCRKQTETAVRQCLRGMDYGIVQFEEGSAFLQSFQKHPCDLVFLDIEMPQMDGITVAKKLRQMSKDVPIIFLTSHIEYALVGYEVNALRYLTKPMDPEKLREVLLCVLERARQQRILWIKTDMGEEKLLIKDILYMEAQNQNIQICTVNKKYSVRYNLGDYEEELAQDGFFRIHRGFLVSLGHIKNIGKNEVTLDDFTVLPVSRSKEKALKDALFQYVRKEAL